MVPAVADEVVRDAEVDAAALDAGDRVGMVLKQIAGLLKKAKDLGEEVAVAFVAAPDIAGVGLDEEGWVALEAPAAAVAYDRAGHMGSLAVVAFAGFATQRDARHPNCCQQRVAVVQGQEAGFVHGRPIVGLVGLLWYLQADRLVDARLVVAAPRPD